MNCRLCTNKCENATEIFKKENLDRLIAQHLNIEVRIDDTFSTVVCRDCSYHLEVFHKFFQLVEQKQNILKNANLSDKADLIEIVKTTESEIVLNVKCEIFEEEFISETGPFEVEHFSEIEAEKNIVRNEALPPPTKEEEEMEKILAQQKKTWKRKRSKRNPEEYQKGEELIAKTVELKCNQCNENFDAFNKLKAHYRQTHNNSEGFVTCCDRHLYNRTELIDHIHSHSDPERFRCSSCDKKFASRKYMQIHMINSHLNGKGSKYECKLCGKGFPWMSELRKHMDCHKIERNYICDECGAKFQGHSRLSSHIKKVHLNEGLQCEFCSQNYRTKRAFIRHVEKHKNGGIVKSNVLSPNVVLCHFCNKGFKSEMSCKAHIIGEHVTEGTIVHFT